MLHYYLNISKGSKIISRMNYYGKQKIKIKHFKNREDWRKLSGQLETEDI